MSQEGGSGSRQCGWQVSEEGTLEQKPSQQLDLETLSHEGRQSRSIPSRRKRTCTGREEAGRGGVSSQDAQLRGPRPHTPSPHFPASGAQLPPAESIRSPLQVPGPRTTVHLSFGPTLTGSWPRLLGSITASEFKALCP